MSAPECMKLCFAPLGSLIQFEGHLDTTGPFIVGGKPQWNTSNGWYGGRSAANGSLLLIDRFGECTTPTSYSSRVRIIAKHWRLHGAIPNAQVREAQNQFRHLNLVSIYSQPSEKVGKKLNNLF